MHKSQTYFSLDWEMGAIPATTLDRLILVMQWTPGRWELCTVHHSLPGSPPPSVRSCTLKAKVMAQRLCRDN